MTNNTRAHAIIENWNYSAVIDRAIKDGLSAADAPEAVKELKAFFQACARNEMNLSPQSHQCDMLWHAFILQTRSYAKFCDEVFGEFLHHETNANPNTLHDAQENAVRLFGTSVFAKKAECGDIRPECGDIRPECGDIRRIAA